MSRVVVQFAFGTAFTQADADAVWTDATQYVKVESAVSITRGASDELAESQPATCRMVLDNSDGRFSSGLATGAYWPNVKKNTPVRVSLLTADLNLIRNPGFEGGISTGWDRGTPDVLSAFPDTAHVQSGTHALRISWDSTDTGGIVQQTLYGLTVGQEYTASAYVYVETGDPTVRLGIEGSTTGAPSTLFDVFERITVTFTATATVHVLQITSTVTSPVIGDRVWLDAVQVEEGDTPTAFDSAGAQLHPRFFGMVNEWPTTWAGLDSTVSITCTDVFKTLSRSPELQPMLVEEVLLNRPLAYYPMGEPEDSLSAGDLSGTTAGALAITQVGSGGTLEFGTDGGPADSLPVPTFTPASSTAGKYLSADLGANFAQQSSEEFLFLEGWFSTTTKGRVIYGLASDSRQFQLVFSLDAATGFLIISYTADGGTLTDESGGTGDLADGVLHHFVYDEFNGNLYVDGSAVSVSVQTMAALRRLTVGAYDSAGLWSGTISHVALHAPASGTAAPGDYTGHHDTGTTEHIGETADERMARLASYAGLTVTTEGTAFSGIASQKALGRSALDHMREVQHTESGKLHSSREDNSVRFQSRSVRYNPAAAATLAYVDLDTDQVQVSDDDQKMINTAILRRPGGATQRILDQTARDLYGPYEETFDLLTETDGEAIDAGNWIVQRFADPPAEIRQVPVEASTLPLATYRALLDADISTAIGITGLPDEAPTATATVTIEGYDEVIKERQHWLDFHTSRTDTASVWVLDDPVYSVLDSTTRLAY